MDIKQVEGLVQTAAGRQNYPPTPDLAARWEKPQPARARPWAWAAAALLVAVLALLSVPQVRARVLEFLRIGAVTILLPEETAPIIAPPTATSARFPRDELLDELSGETTLEEARASVAFEVPLPAYPVGLGDPERIYLQRVDTDRYFVILVWGKGAGVELALYVIGPEVQLAKGPPQIIVELEINGHPAAYVDGVHLLVLEGFHQFERLVDAPALIWEGGDGVTYRLEGDLPLGDLVLIAESLE